MPTTLSAINLKRAVSAALDDYRNMTDQFVADYVSPVVSVDMRSGYLPKFTTVHEKIQDFSVSLTSPSNLVDIGTTSTAYNCVDHSATAYLTNREYKSDTTGLLTASNKAIRLDEAMRLQIENEVMAVVLALSSTSPSTKWDVTGGNAQQDIADLQATMDGTINRVPLHGLCPFNTATALRILTGAAYGRQTTDLPGMGDVANWLGLKEVRVGRAAYDSTKPGKATTRAKLMTASTFLLFYKPEIMAASLPAFMARPRFDELSRPRVYNTDNPEGFAIEVNDCYDIVSIDTNAAALLTAVI